MQQLPDKDVVLLGVGHTNAHILRMWCMTPPPGARLTCVSNHPVATYSGMLPGVLAGQYPRHFMEVDLVRLCASAGARLVVGDVSGLDLAARRLTFHQRPPLPFDVLSIGIGSVPTWAGVEVVDSSHVVAIKPMQTFLARLDARLAALSPQGDDRGSSSPAAMRLVVVGAGAGGVEIALCVPTYIRAQLGPDVRLAVEVLSADGHVAPGALPSTRMRIARTLAARGVSLRRGRVVRVEGGRLTLDDGTTVEADLIIWATGAAAPPLLKAFHLPTDAGGYLATSETLQSVAGLPIFAVGDTGAMEGAALAKAGVYAVRQGPVLWNNINRTLAGQPLQPYRPQRGFLKLLNTGDGRAIGEWKQMSFEGVWSWRLKDRIDRQFIAKYQAPPSPMMERGPETATAPESNMRCVGCGGKVGSTVLARALSRLEVPDNDHVLIGLAAADDAAVVRAGGQGAMVVTVDAFAAPFDDPYLVGRVALLNAASDAFAMDAAPWGALATVTLPIGSARQQEEMLFQVMAGALTELRAMGATLVGGHTIEGPVLSVGFTVLASPSLAPPALKSGLRPGDRLVVTKALGTGVLLAAHMRARCRAVWWSPLLESMLTSNGPAAQVAHAFGVTGLTDVTGFGLAGHLREMAAASRLPVRLDLDAIPLLPGAAELLQEGLESTLAPANREAEAQMVIGSTERASARYRALFDPQTGGGLLIGVAADRASDLVAALVEAGAPAAAVVGEVGPPSSATAPITLVGAESA